MKRKSIKSDLQRIDRLSEAQIDYSDIPPLDATFFEARDGALASREKQLTIRLDADVVEWLKGNGKGYQTRINRILRVVMESQPSRGAD